MDETQSFSSYLQGFLDGLDRFYGRSGSLLEGEHIGHRDEKQEDRLLVSVYVEVGGTFRIMATEEFRYDETLQRISTKLERLVYAVICAHVDCRKKAK